MGEMVGGWLQRQNRETIWQKLPHQVGWWSLGFGEWKQRSHYDDHRARRRSVGLLWQQRQEWRRVHWERREIELSTLGQILPEKMNGMKSLTRSLSQYMDLINTVIRMQILGSSS